MIPAPAPKKLTHTFVLKGADWPAGLATSVDDFDIIAIEQRLDEGVLGVDVWHLVPDEA